MEDITLLIIGSHIVAFLIGRMWGITEAKKIVFKILKERGLI